MAEPLLWALVLRADARQLERVGLASVVMIGIACLAAGGSTGDGPRTAPPASNSRPSAPLAA